MAKKDDLPVEAFEDDGWDFGPPSARRSSLRPGVRRSLRPAAEAVRAVEALRKDDAKRIVDSFVESGWSEPPQADDEPSLIAAPGAVAASLVSSTVLNDAQVVVIPAAPPAPAVSLPPEPSVSVAPAPARVSSVPAEPAVSTPSAASATPTVSASPAARRAAVRSAATRTGPQPSATRTARVRAATPISFPAEARPSVPALSVPAAAPSASVPAAAAKASVPAAPAVVEDSRPAPAPVNEATLAPSSAPRIEIATQAPIVDSHEPEPDSVSGARLVHPSRRPPSATASFRPVVPDVASARPVPRKRMTAASVLPLVSLVLSTMGIGFLMFGVRWYSIATIKITISSSAGHLAMFHTITAVSPAPMVSPIEAVKTWQGG